MKTIQSKFTMSTITLTILLLITSSCKKDEAAAPTKEQLLTTTKGWVLTAKTIVVTGQTSEADYFALIAACKKDNISIFTTDGKINGDEGATKCSSGDPQKTDAFATWAFNTDKTSLTVTNVGSSSGPTVYTILDLSSTILKISGQETFSTIVSGTTITISGLATNTYTAVK
jgi:hypothetical protein